MVDTSGPNIKTIIHPQVGPITLHCDVLTVAGSDLRLAQVIGLQELAGSAAEPKEPQAVADGRR